MSPVYIIATAMTTSRLSFLCRYLADIARLALFDQPCRTENCTDSYPWDCFNPKLINQPNAKIHNFRLRIFIIYLLTAEGRRLYWKQGYSKKEYFDNCHFLDWSRKFSILKEVGATLYVVNVCFIVTVWPKFSFKQDFNSCATLAVTWIWKFVRVL